MMGWVHVRGSWAVKHTPNAQTLGIFFRVTKTYNAMQCLHSSAFPSSSPHSPDVLGPGDDLSLHELPLLPVQAVQHVTGGAAGRGYGTGVAHGGVAASSHQQRHLNTR